MFELIISVCMISAPQSCKDIHLTYVGEIGTPYRCMHLGQPEMAKWSQSNPGWSIQKFHCGKVDMARKEI